MQDNLACQQSRPLAIYFSLQPYHTGLFYPMTMGLVGYEILISHAASHQFGSFLERQISKLPPKTIEIAELPS
jgi:hypothetical protein